MNIKVDFDNIVVKEDRNDFNVKVLMLKGEKGEAGATNWGAITGTLSNQTDLKNALDGKANQSDFNTVSGQVNTNTSNISTINGQITDINGELDDFEDLFYGNATVNGENTSITLNNTVEAEFEEFNLKGNTSQDGIPTPTTPIPVNVVSGDNEIVVSGKNLLDYNNTTVENYFYNASGVKTYDSANEYVNPIIPVIPNTKYTFSSASRTGSGNCRICQFKKDGTFISRTNTDNNLTYNFTTNSECSYVILSIDKSSTKYYTNVQFEKDSATNYEPYQGNTYNIDLPEGMELCKIPNTDYEDTFLHDKVNDKWYWHREIGKVVFAGESSEEWQKFNTSSGHYRFRTYKTGMPKVDNANTKSIMVSNYFENGSPNQTYTGKTCMSNDNGQPNYMYVCYESDDTDTIEKFNAWLSTHNLSVYYPLATPTNTEITYQPLIDKLNAIEQATSKNGETNISQVNDDLPFIIYAEAFANTFNGRMEGMDYKIDNCEVLNNKVTSITSGSTDSEYPSAKAVYDLFNSITDGDEVSY